MRRRTLILLVPLVAISAGIGAVFVLGNGSGTAPSPGSAQQDFHLFSGRPIHHGPVVYGKKTAPPQPVDANGVPALLSHDRDLKTTYVNQLGQRLDPIPKPTHVGFFGHLVSRSADQLVVRRAPVTVSAPGALSATVTPWVGAGDMTVKLTHKTILMLKGSLDSLRPATELIVGGRQISGTFVAELVAEPKEMERRDAGARARLASGAPATRASFKRIADNAVPSARPSSRVTASNQKSHLTGLVQTIPPGPDHLLASDVTPVSPENQPDTVEFSGETGILPGPQGVINPHFNFGVDLGPCSATADAEALLANDFSLHWPFQFVPNGDGFDVVSLDQPTTQHSFSFGPFQGHLDAGLTDDPSSYSIYSGIGVALNLSASIGCHTEVFGVQIGFDWGLAKASISWSFVNKTVDHIPLSGEPNLIVPPNQCLSGQTGFGDWSIGVQGCLWLTLSGGRFRATITGQGGTPQGIAVSYQHGDVVHSQTAPMGGPVRVDKFDYSPYLATHVAISPFVDHSKDLHFGKVKPRLTPEQRAAGVFTPDLRHKNQVGPILPNGNWQKKTNRKWYTADEKETDPPADLRAAKQAGDSNWIHPNQVGLTLQNGDWLHRDGVWRNSGGTKIKDPTPGEQLHVNLLTEIEPEPQAAPEVEPPPEVQKDMHGLINIDGGPPAPLPADQIDPSSLFLLLPIQAAAPPQPPAQPQSCSIPGGAEGGAALPFTTTGLSCPDGARLVDAALTAFARTGFGYGTTRTIDVQGFACQVTSPGVVAPGSQVTCTKGAEAVRFELPG